jgi:alkanesulfonate monooxygenase SsuD/methylene tetrahydromethanopterin reductase-like flavin-dependent oxidoreductase (luciferase family)
MNIVAGGPNAVVNGVAQAYQQLREKFRDGNDNLNPQVTTPMVGAVRHFFVADSDREAEQIARPAYKIYYDNIVKLWRDHGTIPSMFTDDLDRASNADAAIVGSPAKVRERIARYFEQSSCNYLVLSFAWGNLTHEQSLKSLNLFASKVMPEFVGRA